MFLALLILVDAVLQLAQALGQPLFTPGRILCQPLRIQRMRLKAGSQGLLFVEDVLMLLEELAVLGVHPADFLAQLNQGFFKAVDHLAGAGLFFLVKA